MSNSLIVRVTNDAELVKDLIADGYAAIECSIGGESLVCDLEMDHHGSRSHLESVAIRAYRDHYGARKSDPRFVVVGTPDADATFAIASLAGLLPHPSVFVPPGLPKEVKDSKQRDLTSLAETIALIDVDPIGRDISEMLGGSELLFWNALMAFSRDNDTSGVGGVFLWQQVTSGAPPRVPLIEAALITEQHRREWAKGDVIISLPGKVGYLEKSSGWNFDVWYGRRSDYPADTLEGWEYVVLLSYVTDKKSITIGCPNLAIAEKVFGKGGLKNVYPQMPDEGWGGRESVGGSPRDLEMNLTDLKLAADKVVSLVNK